MSEYQNLLADALKFSESYLTDLEEMPVFPHPESLALLENFDEPLNQAGQAARDILASLQKYGSPNTVASNGPRYFGFVTGGTYPIGHAAKWLSTTWDQNNALYAMSPIAAKLEEVAEKWLIDLLGIDQTSGIGFHSGGSEANLVALFIARNTLLKRKGYDLRKNGFQQAPEIKVVLSQEIHGSIAKTLNFIGIGENAVTLIPTDSNGAIIPEKIPPLDDQTIVIIQSGNINSGSFDNIEKTSALTKATGAWLHVDGAIGLWAAAKKKFRHFMAGIEKADSLTTDGHKLLNLPYDSGLLICRDKENMINMLHSSGSYLSFNPEQRDNMHYTLEMSRRARVIELWATLKYLGKEGVEKLVDQLVENARYFADGLEKMGLEIMNDVVFNQVIFCLSNENATKKLLEEIQSSSVFWCGSTVWQGKFGIRLSISSWKITPKEIDRCLKIVEGML